MSAYGIDGCRGGWIAASAPSFEANPEFELFHHFHEVVRTVTRTGTVGFIDMPIGLSDAPRACDVEARKLLGSIRASSVFTPPGRKALGGTRAHMREINLHATGRSLSEQCLGILPKIREVDDVMTPDLQQHVREVHPEVTFAALSPARAGLAESKKTSEGQKHRRSLLPPAFARAVDARPFPAGVVGVDDYIDALAALTTAIRFCSGRAARLPATAVETDEKGLRMDIWY
jgi:predicted RNase H-like nuclease